MQNQNDDLHPQPFHVGDRVRINPEFTPLNREAKNSIDKIMTVEKVYWLGFGDEDNPYGCESGWVVSTDTMKHFDSHWFIKYDEKGDDNANNKENKKQ